MEQFLCLSYRNIFFAAVGFLCAIKESHVLNTLAAATGQDLKFFIQTACFYLLNRKILAFIELSPGQLYCMLKHSRNFYDQF